AVIHGKRHQNRRKRRIRQHTHPRGHHRLGNPLHHPQRPAQRRPDVQEGQGGFTTSKQVPKELFGRLGCCTSRAAPSPPPGKCAQIRDFATQILQRVRETHPLDRK
ncbi:hypothetical protein CORC01_06924, partial [Colletotrichum orchidophilum]